MMKKLIEKNGKFELQESENISSEISKKISEVLGIKVKVPEIKEKSKFNWSTSFKWSPFDTDFPKEFGVLAPIFTEINLEIAVMVDEDAYGFILKYKWKHPQGSNGYQTRFIYRDRNKKWKQD